MKKVIAVVLTMAMLVMLFAVSAPALAKPSKLEIVDADTGKGQASLRQDKDGYLIVSVSLRSAAAGEDFKIELQYFDESYTPINTYRMVNPLTTNSRGAGRYKVTDTSIGKYSGANWMIVWLVTEDLLGDTYCYKTTDYLPVEFP